MPPKRGVDAPDPYKDVKELGIFKPVGQHKWSDVNAGTIVERILKSRSIYEERQRLKGVKADKEDDMVN